MILIIDLCFFPIILGIIINPMSLESIPVGIGKVFWDVNTWFPAYNRGICRICWGVTYRPGYELGYTAT